MARELKLVVVGSDEFGGISKKTAVLFMGFGKKLKKAVKSYARNPFNAKKGLQALSSVTRHFRQRLGLRRKQIFPFTANGYYADSVIDSPYGATGSIASKFSR